MTRQVTVGFFIDTEKPKKKYCPSKPKTIVDPSLTPINITFDEPTFTDNVGVVKIDKINEPGKLVLGNLCEQ